VHKKSLKDRNNGELETAGKIYLDSIMIANINAIES
jgi:hypothetical protein